MKIYEVVGKNNKFFSTLEKAQKYVLSLDMIEKVRVDVNDYRRYVVYRKKMYPSYTDFTNYEFYDCLTSGMSYTDFLLKNKCLECNTKIYFENIPPVTIEEIEVE